MPVLVWIQGCASGWSVPHEDIAFLVSAQYLKTPRFFTESGICSTNGLKCENLRKSRLQGSVFEAWPQNQSNVKAEMQRMFDPTSAANFFLFSFAWPDTQNKKNSDLITLNGKVNTEQLEAFQFWQEIPFAAQKNTGLHAPIFHVGAWARVVQHPNAPRSDRLSVRTFIVSHKVIIPRGPASWCNALTFCAGLRMAIITLTLGCIWLPFFGCTLQKHTGKRSVCFHWETIYFVLADNFWATAFFPESLKKERTQRGSPQKTTNAAALRSSDLAETQPFSWNCGPTNEFKNVQSYQLLRSMLGDYFVKKETEKQRK